MSNQTFFPTLDPKWIRVAYAYTSTTTGTAKLSKLKQHISKIYDTHAKTKLKRNANIAASLHPMVQASSDSCPIDSVKFIAYNFVK